MIALDVAFWITAVAILVLVGMSAFFSGSETALTGASRAKLRARADRGEGGARKALDLTRDSERLLGALLLGNNVVNILAAALATSLLTRVFGDSGVALATLVMTLLVLIFGEVLPKTWAISAPEDAASLLSRPVALIVAIFSPAVAAVRVLVRAILWLLGVRTSADSRIMAIREEILGAITLGHTEGAVEKEDRDRLLGALDLGERTVEEVMRHRSAVEMLDAGLAPAELIDRALASTHSRLPLYRDQPDNIVGILHSKDLMRAIHARRVEVPENPFAGFDVVAVAQRPWFVPETTALDVQMRQFLKRRRHFALVVDEYGTLQGLITLEDILEEIVGQIADEYDIEPPPLVHRDAEGWVTVDGAMTIRDFNRATEWKLSDEEANTVAGLVIHEARVIPEVGRVFLFDGYRFEVMARKDNRLTRLRVARAP